MWRKLFQNVFLTMGGCFAFLQHASADVKKEKPTPLTGLYMNFYGGGGAVMSGIDIVQQATALYDTDHGGPIAVNAKGTSDGRGFWLVGGSIGYNWFTMPLNQSKVNMSAAIELEGFYIGQHTIKAPHQNNKYSALPSHIFSLSLPVSMGGALVNMVFDFSTRDYAKWHGYFGVGWGSAVVTIDHAKAVQIVPSEPGVNHFSGDSGDSSVAFIAQPKIGMIFDCNSWMSIFGEYRFLYVSDTDYQFGSTISPGHVTTTNWLLKMGPQLSNIGIFGIRFKF